MVHPAGGGWGQSDKSPVKDRKRASHESSPVLAIDLKCEYKTKGKKEKKKKQKNIDKQMIKKLKKNFKK